MRNLSAYLKVTEAAKLLGVTSKTLRNWDRSGKLRPARNPANGYRLYRREDLDSFLARVEAEVDPGDPPPAEPAYAALDGGEQGAS